MAVLERLFARAVVTGGAGFLGSHLCDALRASGCDVVCIDSLITGVAGNIEGLRSDLGFHFWEADVAMAPLAVHGPVDVVFHLASPASPKAYTEFPVETLRANSFGTANALELAASKNARFVLASTSEVYGDPLVHPQREDYWGNVNPVGPRSMYDEGKRFAEALTFAYRNSLDVDAIVVRLFNTYGPRMRPDDGRVVSSFIRQALTGAPLTVAGDGSQTRSLCYVDDIVQGLMAAASSCESGPINLGSTAEMSVLSLATLVRDMCGSTSSIEFVERTSEDPERRRPDITLARQLLGWWPETSVQIGVPRTVSWMRSISELES